MEEWGREIFISWKKKTEKLGATGGEERLLAKGRDSPDTKGVRKKRKDSNVRYSRGSGKMTLKKNLGRKRQVRLNYMYFRRGMEARKGGGLVLTQL